MTRDVGMGQRKREREEREHESHDHATIDHKGNVKERNAHVNVSHQTFLTKSRSRVRGRLWTDDSAKWDERGVERTERAAFSAVNT